MANLITLLRLPLLVIVVGLLYSSNPILRVIAAFLNIVLIVMDSLDGYVARRRGETSLLGSVLDIAADRTVELVLWVVYADLNLIPILIPLVVLARGTFVDAVRAVAPSRGVSPFDLMRSQVGRFMVKSPLFRSTYAVAKGFAFFFLALAHGLTAAQYPLAGAAMLLAQISVWLAFVLCLVRGIPVLIEAPRILSEPTRLG
ncbi:MAG TPA: CDP-alcohol phosphatidyltransferase family protein [Anaerolineae bacterium]|nr:CDP-alcohol phosphatidyltransferase family protein [Anaerolineae bacterium]